MNNDKEVKSLIKKLVYKKPELKIHGDVKKLTKGPTGSGIESNSKKHSLP